MWAENLSWTETPFPSARPVRPGLRVLWFAWRELTTVARLLHSRGKFLSALPDESASLDDGEFFHYQLIGMQVRTEDGEELGEIKEILETGSNDVYIVRGPAGEVLIPAVAHVVTDVDVSSGVMLVRLPDGLR